MAQSRQDPRGRFGIGEWYGRSFLALDQAERKQMADLQALPKARRPPRVCPFQPTAADRVTCTKEGGVCSLRMYECGADGSASAVPGLRGSVRVTCPLRFNEGGMIYRWVAEVILGCHDPIVIGQVGFLQNVSTILSEEDRDSDVGRIDNVVVAPDSDPLAWCALEIQAVYFSGSAMNKEFRPIADANGLPLFPAAIRRPDYRSSGPKRLMPQLQIKVPSLRRWGKKMAVVVDETFFGSLADMHRVEHVSNCDIAWFVVGLDVTDSDFRLVRRETHFTTLERAVEGLTAGTPVSLDEFERRIRARTAASNRRA